MPRRPPPPPRGATSNAASTRFNLPAREADGDWLDEQAGIDGDPPPLKNTVAVEHPRTIITRNYSPDIGLDRSINPYRGWAHGSISIISRTTPPYHAMLPGLNF